MPVTRTRISPVQTDVLLIPPSSFWDGGRGGWLCPYAEPLSFCIYIRNSTGAPGVEQPAVAVHLDAYAPAVAIYALDSEDGMERMVWQGYFTGGPTDLGPNETGHCTFTWDQRDATGHQVAPGRYLVRFLPFFLSARGGEDSFRDWVESYRPNYFCILDPES